MNSPRVRNLAPYALVAGLTVLASSRSFATNADIVFVIDGSGSTASQYGSCKFDFEKQAIASLICAGTSSGCSTCPYSQTNCTCACAGAQSLPADGSIKVAVVQFSQAGTEQVEVPLQQLTASSAASIYCITNCIAAINLGTDIASGLNKALTVLQGETVERLVVLMTDEQPQNDATLLAAANSLKNAGIRICTVRISDPVPNGHDFVCGTPCAIEDMTRIANSVYAYNSSQPRGAFRCLQVCDAGVPTNDPANFAAVRSLVLGSVCALGQSTLGTLPAIAQSPSAASVGQDVSVSIAASTTAGLIDYQWQRERPEVSGGWEDIPGDCTNPGTAEGVRPLACGGTRYRCIVTTPCNAATSNSISLSFGSLADCNHDGSADICQRIPTYQWTGTVGGTGNDVVGGEGKTFNFTTPSLVPDDAPGTAVAPTGELVYTGNFAGSSVNMNPLGSPADSQTSAGSDDGFVTRLGATGEWTRTFGGTVSDKGYGVAVDQQDGTVYVVGAFRGSSVDFSRELSGSSASGRCEATM